MPKYFAIKDVTENLGYVAKDDSYDELKEALLFDTFEKAEKRRIVCRSLPGIKEIVVPVYVHVTMQEGENIAITSPGNLSFY